MEGEDGQEGEGAGVGAGERGLISVCLFGFAERNVEEVKVERLH